MEYSPPGSSVHEILQAKMLKWVAVPFQGRIPTQGSNSCLLCLLHCQADSFLLAPLLDIAGTISPTRTPIYLLKNIYWPHIIQGAVMVKKSLCPHGGYNLAGKNVDVQWQAVRTGGILIL